MSRSDDARLGWKPGGVQRSLPRRRLVLAAELTADGLPDLAVAGEEKVVVLLGRGEEGPASDRRPEDRRQ